MFYRDNTEGKGYIAKLLVQSDNSISSFTVFTQQVKSLLTQLNITQDLEDCLIEPAIIAKLPVTIRYTATIGQKISDLTVLRNVN